MSDSFHIKVAGVTFQGRQETVAKLSEGDPLTLEREPDNPYDPNAIKVLTEHGEVGYVPREYAAAVGVHLSAGTTYTCTVSELPRTGDMLKAVGCHAVIKFGAAA